MPQKAKTPASVRHVGVFLFARSALEKGKTSGNSYSYIKKKAIHIRQSHL